MKLSVIVPVYNVEKFLPRCLDSLLRQGLEVGEYEVICVNDGSPDNCVQILAEYEQKYPGIFRVITQENRGLGEARNTGMKVAQGEYITFVDSDDYVVDGAYRYLLDHFCTEQKPDVLHFQYRMVFTDGSTFTDPETKPDGKVTFDGDGVEAYNKFIHPAVWNKFFRHQFLLEHNLKFEKIFYEDNLFNFCLFRCHPWLVIVSCNIIRYEQGNADSIIHTLNKEHVFKEFKDLQYLINLMKHSLEDVPELAPAIRLNLKSCYNTYNKKLFRINLSYDEWSHYTRILRHESAVLQNYKKETTTLGRIIKWLKSHSLRSYFIYCIFYVIMILWHNVGLKKIFIHY